MIRIIVRTVDVGAAVNVGGPVAESFRTFDVSLPDLEAYLRENSTRYVSAQVIGVEVAPTPTREEVSDGR